ncbi:protein-L-isoaspartate carboxylmethyltransferase [Microbacterium sp. NEAU-LLC]|uniref:Protein-L-isoaspartate carboxylmethyltransferase n=1 Tax=Microbacterium helvum TaxID=2773713 RepID=A0ABR8NRT3_9MICO|nr:protein-L-isoaspartate carboxylmethyltransferase [Microbacterium helvum]MBD3942703.1 protein-L-isoaspartate carboxylmethyltransferase [Microbacterium helvum]
MAFRNLETLESWLAEYREMGRPLAGSARVTVQDGDGGADTGLVVFRLDHASTAVFIQPATRDASGWVATMEPREEAVVLDAPGLLELSAELAAVSELCAFLEEKSRTSQGDTVA